MLMLAARFVGIRHFKLAGTHLFLIVFVPYIKLKLVKGKL